MNAAAAQDRSDQKDDVDQARQADHPGAGRDRLAALRLVIGLILAAGTTLLLFIVLAPQHDVTRALSELPGIAHALAFARISGALLITIAIVSLVVSLIAQFRGRRRGRFRAFRSLFRLVGLGMIGAGIVLMIWPSGWVTAPQGPEDSGGGDPKRTITLVIYNSQDTLSWDVLKTIEWHSDPDLIILPESSGAANRAATTQATVPFAVYETQDSGFTSGYHPGIAPTTILSRSDRITLEPTKAAPTTFGSVGVRLADDRDFTVLGVHTAPPLPGHMTLWRSDLQTIAETAASQEAPTVIAGDFNATLRHGPLADLPGYRDATLACEPQGLGTWPSDIPTSVSAPIDHVFIREDVEVRECLSLRFTRGDHRAVIVTLAR